MKKIFICAQIFAMIGIAAADPMRRLPEVISYENFVSLLKFDAGRVPKLAELWANGSPNLYWGGGTLRGFLHWHYLQLQTKTIAEVMATPVPDLAGLQLPGGSDVDIFGPYTPTDAERALVETIPDGDYFRLTVYPEFVRLGGPTIEKILLNPYKVIDPKGGLRHYFDGKIVFDLPTTDALRKSKWIRDNDFTRTGEALRFLRFAEYNLPECVADVASVNLIRQFANIDGAFVLSEGRMGWIETALDKLLTAASGNLVEVLAKLRDYNLLEFLGTHGQIGWIDAGLEDLLRTHEGHISELLDALHRENLLELILRLGVHVPEAEIHRVREWIKDPLTQLTTEERARLLAEVSPSFHRRLRRRCEAWLSGWTS